MTIRTGFGTTWGVPYDTNASIAADEFNAAGGIRIGDTRYLVDLEILDSKYEAPTMLSIAEQFVNRKKDKFVETNGSPMIEVMNPISAPAKVIHMSTTGNLEPCESDHTFCTMPTQFETAPTFFRVIQLEQPQVKKVFYLEINFTSDIGAAGLGQHVAESMGYEWDEVFAESPVVDTLSLATGIMRSDPDLILIGALGDDTSTSIRSFRDLGYEGVIGSLYAIPTIPQLLDAFKGGEEHLLENCYAVEETSYDADGNFADDDLLALVNEYRAREPGEAQSGIVTFYYTMRMLLESIEKAQTVTDTDKIKEVLETTEWVNRLLPGDPVMSFGGAGKSPVALTLRQKHMIWQSMAMNVYRNGKRETLEIFSAAPIGPLPEHLAGPPVYTPSTPTATPTPTASHSPTPTPTATATPQPLRTESLGIGTMTIRTGSGASFGVPFDTGQSIAVDRVNDAGGIVIGDVRYLVKHEKLDSKWEVPIMLSISEQFINRRKYKFVITGGSPMIEVMDPVSAPAKVIHMSTTRNLEPCESAHTFCTMPTQFETAPTFFKVIQREEPQVKKVFYAGMNFTYDIRAAGLGQHVAERMGYTWDSIFME